MKSKTSNYIIWIVVLIVLIAAFVLIRSGKQSQEKQLADKYQDVKEDSAPTPASAAAAYKTEGGNEQENDNFFVSGRVNVLADLADKNKKATIVWFSAPWCEICHAMRPFVYKSMNKFADTVAIKEIDFDSNRHLVSQLGLYGTPDFIVIDKDGREVKRWGGATQSNFESQVMAISQLN